MSKKAPLIDTLLGDVDTPAPPSALKDMVLQATFAALNREPAPDIWSRIWESRPLRLAWVAAISVLIAGHLAITAAQQEPQVASVTVVDNAVDPELVEIIDLPRLRLAGRSLSGSYIGDLG